MKTIRKYFLKIEPEQKFKVPFNSEIVGIWMWGRKACLFIIEDNNDDKKVERTFIIVGTDTELSQRLNKTHYVGSFEHYSEAGPTILHVFEER